MFVAGDKITTVKYTGGPSFRNARLVFEDKQVKVVPTMRAYVFESVFQFILWFSYVFMFNDILFIFDQELLNAAIFFFFLFLALLFTIFWLNLGSLRCSAARLGCFIRVLRMKNTDCQKLKYCN